MINQRGSRTAAEGIRARQDEEMAAPTAEAAAQKLDEETRAESAAWRCMLES